MKKSHPKWNCLSLLTKSKEIEVHSDSLQSKVETQWAFGEIETLVIFRNKMIHGAL